MTVFTERNLNQQAVYWATPVEDGYGGHTWATPIEIDCRWVDKIEVILSRTARAGAGEELVSRAQVQVSQDLDEQGMLFLGELTDLTVAEKTDPATISNAYSIKQFAKVSTIKGTAFYRKAWL